MLLGDIKGKNLGFIIRILWIITKFCQWNLEKLTALNHFLISKMVTRNLTPQGGCRDEIRRHKAPIALSDIRHVQ